ncbi:MAG: hypothetical protein QXF83_03085 [Candidatus Bathyarchaeia archaeon]
MWSKLMGKSTLLMLTFIMFYLGGIPVIFAQPNEWVMSLGGASNDEGWIIIQTFNEEFIVVGETWSFGAGEGDIWVIKINPAGDIQWQKTYGTERIESPMDADLTLDQGIVIAGLTTLPGRTDFDLFILKLKAQGELEWYKIYGGTDNDWAMCIEQTSDGGYIVGGATHSFGAAFRDFWVLKLDTSGEIMWEKRYGGSGVERRVENIHQTVDGGYILAGTSDSFSGGSVWVLKLKSDGNIDWQYVYGPPGGDVEDIQVTRDGGYIVLAETGQPQDAWILKLKADGDIEWQKKYGGPGDEDVQPIRQTVDGGYVIAGSTTSFGVGDEDLWILKVDINGNIEWQRTYGGTASDEAYSLMQAFDFGYMIVGETESFGSGMKDVFLLKLDSLGRIRECPYLGFSEAISADIEAQRTATAGFAYDTNADKNALSISVMDTDAKPNIVCPTILFSPSALFIVLLIIIIVSIVPIGGSIEYLKIRRFKPLKTKIIEPRYLCKVCGNPLIYDLKFKEWYCNFCGKRYKI